MKFLLTVCVFLLTVSSAVVDITVTGTEGRGVSITCPYPGGFEKSTKYFYKGVYRDSDIILRSDGTKTFPRFSLKDNHQSRSFTVTICDLRMDDAGPYGCRAGWGEYKVIQLNVIREKKRPVQISTSSTCPFTTTSSDHTSTVPPTQSSSNQHEVNSHPPSEQEVKGSYVIIVTAEALVLLLIAVPLVIVAVRKKKKTDGLLSFSIVEFNPVIYEQIRDTGRHCNPEDTETTVIYSCLS